MIMIYLIATLASATAILTPPVPRSINYFGTLRMRSESWNWFQPASPGVDGNYTFSHNQLRFGGVLPPGHRVSGLRPFETLFEVEAPLLLGLPKHAIAPAPEGSFGAGAAYRLANGSQQGSLFIKQAYIRMPQTADSPEVQIGRMELMDGSEIMAKNADLAYIQTQRTSSRLFGTDPFTAVGRSMEGVKLTRTRPGHVLTAAAFYPVTGAFNLDGGDTITKVRQVYFADSRSTQNTSNRWFVESFTDARGIKAIDNASVSTTGAINVTTVGGHAITAATRGAVRTDALFWGAMQGGEWGSSRIQSNAALAEVGIKHPALGGWWLRGGGAHFSGDSNPTDNKHATFYPQLTAPRLYGRTPIYTEANVNDIFLMLIKRNKKETLRLETHGLYLDKLEDRWYSLGGAFQATGPFGLVAKPSGGSRSLGSLVDISYDVTMNPRDTVSLYAGYFHGGDVVKASYAGQSAFLGFMQIVHKL